MLVQLISEFKIINIYFIKCLYSVMYFFETIYLSWHLYTFLGITYKVYGIYNYSIASLTFVSNAWGYLTGLNNRPLDMSESVLIEKKTVENNWQLINFFRQK